MPSAVPDSILGDSNYFFGRFDMYVGQKDHFSVSLWHQRAAIKYNSLLPHELATESTSNPQNSSVHRFNWDHTFGSNLLNHLTFGYLNRNEGYGCVNTDAVDKLPKIQGVVSNNVPSPMSFSDGFASFGCGGSLEADSITTRPTYVLNDLVTFIKGSHTIKIGGEYRNIGGNTHNRGNEQGSFNFGRGATGLPGVISGNPIASFLLGAVDNANLDVRTASTAYPRQKAWIFHAGDTWNATSKLTLELRSALGLLLALEREVRPARVLRPQRRESRRPAAAWAAWRTRAPSGARRATARGTPRRTGTAASPRVSAPPTRSTPRRSSVRDGGSSTTARSTPGGAPAWPRTASTAT